MKASPEIFVDSLNGESRVKKTSGFEIPFSKLLGRELAGLALHPVIRFLGSLKLAMLLLATIIVACITGTLLESRFDSAIAQGYVYGTPWFIAWLLLLCVNLVCAAFVRYPWKPHQTGFVITHAGIITILLGAVVGRIWGVEGTITLFKGDRPLTYSQILKRGSA